MRSGCQPTLGLPASSRQCLSCVASNGDWLMRTAGKMPATRVLGAMLAVLFFALVPARSQQLFMEDTAASPAVIEKMYVRGLQFLAETQQKDGYWAENYGSQPGVVGLAAVAFLAHGDDPNNGPFSGSIHQALDFVIKNQNSETGYIGTTMYNHGFGALALAEAYGAVDNAKLGPALEKAIQLILVSQKQNPKGAWRYSPETKEADTTVSGAQMVALFAARNAGLGVPEDAIAKGLDFFKRCQSPQGGYGYTSAAGPNAARTAIGVLVLALAKQKSTPEFKSAFTFLENQPGESHYYQYYLYYASQAYFHASPVAFRKWNARNITSLAATQNKNGSWDGPFGATFATSASLLSLALNYRYLPIYER